MAGRRRRPGELSPSAWAAAIRELYGLGCIECGDINVELDHVIPKSHGGLYVPGNGVPVCGPWSKIVPGEGHHGQKTAGKLQYRRDLLHPVTIEYLDEQGWVTWDLDGQPRGRGWRHFAPIPVPVEGWK